LKHTCIAHSKMCNIPIYFCNILIKHLQHISKTSETFKMYACNMHRISMWPPSPFASRRHIHSRRWSQRASAPGPTLLLVRWPQPRERSPRVGAMVLALSGEGGRRAKAAGWRGGAWEWAARGDRRRRSGPQSRSSGATNGAGAGGWLLSRGAGLSSPFFYPIGAM
jgi:hypothetical protein